MYNVLIADDESSVCMGLCSIIDWNKYGFYVKSTAKDGEEALAMLKEGRYNLVVTDIRMPVMDGLELAKAIHYEKPMVRMLIISGYSDFNYAKSAIKYGVNGYLLKPIDRDELTQYVMAIKEELDKETEDSMISRNDINLARQKLLFDMANGEADYKTLPENLRRYGITLDGDCYNIAILEIENFYSELEKNLDDANLIKFSIHNITGEIVEQAHLGYAYEDIDGTLGILLNGSADTLKTENVRTCLQKIICSASRYLDIRVTISCGEPVRDLPMLKKARKQAKQALERKIIADGSSFIAFSEITYGQNTIFDMEWDSRELLSSIEELDRVGTDMEVDRLILEITNKRFTIDAVKILLNNIVFEIVALLRKYGSTEKIPYFRQEISGKVDNCASPGDMSELLTLICGEARNEILQLQKNKRPNIISQIKKYVGQHYSEDLNLKTISGIFYMSPVYLGRLYKNSTGEAFSDYINKIRIAEVKKMLMTDISKIGDIIKKSGYRNQEYFYRSFRKYEGISFAEYKEIHKIK